MTETANPAFCKWLQLFDDEFLLLSLKILKIAIDVEA